MSISSFLVPTSQLATSESITSSVSLALSQCPSNLYIIISQPGVTASDFSRKTTPSLHRYISPEAGTSPLRSSTSVKDVVGEIDTQKWRDMLEADCTKWSVDIDASPGSLSTIGSDAAPGLVNVHLPAPSVDGEKRQQDLAENDARLASIFEYAVVKDYTVLYTTTPDRSSKKVLSEEPNVYEMGDEASLPLEAMRIDLKRDLSRRAGGKVYENQTMVDGPLFEKYQFLSPGMSPSKPPIKTLLIVMTGIFMGFTVGLILLFILYVGISALSSLQVSYAAFDKENVQSQTRKVQ